MHNITLPYGTKFRKFRFMNACTANVSQNPITGEIVDCEVFISYKTVVGVRQGEEWWFSEGYSPTTSKQLTVWSSICTKERKRGIKSGKYHEF